MMTPELPIWLDLLIIFFVTVLVRFYSIMAGGGRLVLIPLLTVLLNLDPSVAIATMKFSGLSNSVSLIKFNQAKLIKWRIWQKIMPWEILGVLIGIYLVINIDQEIFQKLLSVSVSLGVIAILFFRRINKPIQFESKMNIGIYFLSTVAGTLGALFGFKGAFIKYIYVKRRLTFLEATATNQATNTIGNFISVISFIAVGLINWPVAIVMLIAGGIGSWLGASFSIKIGSKWVERIFLGAIIVGGIFMFLQS